MHVPKATMNQKDFSVSRQNDIWLGGQLFIVKRKAVAEAVNDGTNDSFRISISASNAGYIPAALLRC